MQILTTDCKKKHAQENTVYLFSEVNIKDAGH